MSKKIEIKQENFDDVIKIIKKNENSLDSIKSSLNEANSLVKDAFEGSGKENLIKLINEIYGERLPNHKQLLVDLADTLEEVKKSWIESNDEIARVIRNK